MTLGGGGAIKHIKVVLKLDQRRRGDGTSFMPKKQHKQNLALRNPDVKKKCSPQNRGIKKQTTLVSLWGLHDVKDRGRSSHGHDQLDKDIFFADDQFSNFDEDEMVECFKIFDEKWIQETIDMFPDIFA